MDKSCKLLIIFAGCLARQNPTVLFCPGFLYKSTVYNSECVSRLPVAPFQQHSGIVVAGQNGGTLH